MKTPEQLAELYIESMKGSLLTEGKPLDFWIFFKSHSNKKIWETIDALTEKGWYAQHFDGITTYFHIDLRDKFKLEIWRASNGPICR